MKVNETNLMDGNENCCPVCGKDLHETDSFCEGEEEYIDLTIGYPFHCNSCGTKGMMWMEMDFVPTHFKDDSSEVKAEDGEHCPSCGENLYDTDSWLDGNGCDDYANPMYRSFRCNNCGIEGELWGEAEYVFSSYEIQ